MLNLILKNLWARRRRNGWLLAELILVAILSWVILDPVIVLTHDRSLALGYDADRLCIVSLASLGEGTPGYEPEATDSAALVDSYLSLVRHAQDFEGVEAATPLLGFLYPNSQGNGYNQYFVEGDSLSHNVMWVSFLPHTRFFETYGFRAGKGRTPAELSDYDYAENDIVLTERAAYDMYGTTDAQGRRAYTKWGNDTIYKSIVGMTGSFKMYSDNRPAAVSFVPKVSIDTQQIPDYARILIRVRDGVSMKRFMEQFRPWMLKDLRRGNLYARTVTTYDSLIAEREANSSTPLRHRNVAMAAFFLVNLCLGVVGTFWLQTRTRREEVGVMRSFGATPRRIMGQLMGEGAVLTVLASLAGFAVYLNYAVAEGLYKGMDGMRSSVTFEGGVPASSLDFYWVESFGQHFCIVSGMILVLLLAVVLTGIYIPARNISRVPPTEALRDE